MQIDQATLQQSIIEERTLAAIHDLSLGAKPREAFLGEVLGRLCKAPNLTHLLPAACYFDREFAFKETRFTVSIPRQSRGL
jgi:hypothetical protein